MDYLVIEKALQEVTGDDEKYRNLAGTFESILNNPNTGPAEKAREIAKVIREGKDYPK